jgi:hypothetical protein
MSDTELDQLLRSADPAAQLTAPTPPPFRDEATVVPLRPRRIRWLSAVAAAAAVVAVVGLAVVTLGSRDGGTRTAGPDPTGTPSTVAPTEGGPLPVLAQRVEAALQADLPPGYQSSIVGWVPSSVQRDYQAYIGVHPGAYTDEKPRAEVMVQHVTNVPAGDLCTISIKMYVQASTCRVVRTPAGAAVALSDDDPAVHDPRPATQWALYQDPDGSVVLVVQAPRDETPGMRALGHNIWTAVRLAEVATDPALRP